MFLDEIFWKYFENMLLKTFWTYSKIHQFLIRSAHNTTSSSSWCFCIIHHLLTSSKSALLTENVTVGDVLLYLPIPAGVEEHVVPVLERVDQGTVSSLHLTPPAWHHRWKSWKNCGKDSSLFWQDKSGLALCAMYLIFAGNASKL